MIKWLKSVLLIAGLAVLFLFVFPFAHNYQYLLRYKFAAHDHGDSLWMTAYIVAGTTYDAALRTLSSFETAIVTPEPPRESPLRTINLRIEPGSLEKMISGLPESAKAQYYQAWLEYPDGNWRRIQYRLRGRSDLHWHIEKPSLRLKLRRDNPLEMLRHINLTNPKDRPLLGDVFIDELARDMGVLTHFSETVRVFINGDYRGVYQMHSREDEEMLRRNHRWPGPMYFGNDLTVPWRKQGFEISGDLDVLRTLDRDPIDMMLDAMALPPGPDRSMALWSVLDMDKYARWHGAMVMAGSLHADPYHNQLFYFDSSAGKLEFITNDISGYGTLNYPRTWRRLVQPEIADHRSPLNELLQPLLDIALRDPRFHHLRNQTLYGALTGSANTEKQIERLEAKFATIDADAHADRNKAAIADTFVGVTRLPYSNRDYERAKDQTLDWIKRRNAFLLAELDKASVRVVASRRRIGPTTPFVVEVDGNAAVRFDTRAFGGRLRADRSLSGRPVAAVDALEILHPGLKEDREFAYDNYTYLRRDPSYYLMPDVQRYVFAAEGEAESLIAKIGSAFKNALSDQPLKPEILWRDELDPTAIAYNSVSIHPWRFKPEATNDVVLGPGLVELDNDLIVGPRQRLRIEPGTELRLAEGVSIASKGVAQIVGRPDAPITIRQKDRDRPWGAIVIHGPDARGSRIAFADISGGSKTRLFNVPYLGMVNVHWTDGFRLERSVLAANVESDDTLHVIHSTFTVSDSTFRDCFGDCLDFDYANGSVENIEIAGAGNDGVDFMTSTVSVRGVRVARVGDKGLSVGEASQVEARDGAVANSVIGIAIKDASTLSLEHWTLIDNEVAIDVSKKNWRYGAPGRADIATTNFNANEIDIRVEKGGRALFHGMRIPDQIRGDGEIRRATD